MTRPTVLALDLEGTLISNAMSQIPRPGLYTFLSICKEMFPRIVMMTTIGEVLFRKIASTLVNEGAAPDWFASIEYVNWEWQTKDLKYVKDASMQEILLVDDYIGYVHEGQNGQWIEAIQFAPPYTDDFGLIDILLKLEKRIGEDE